MKSAVQIRDTVRFDIVTNSLGLYCVAYAVGFVNFAFLIIVWLKLRDDVHFAALIDIVFNEGVYACLSEQTHVLLVIY